MGGNRTSGPAGQATPTAQGPGIPVLLYHSVGEQPSGWIAPFTVSRATFERHLIAEVDDGEGGGKVKEKDRREPEGEVGGSELSGGSDPREAEDGEYLRENEIGKG